MKQAILLFFCLLFLYQNASAQDAILKQDKLPKNIYFEDDFSDNRNQWTLYDHSSAKADIKNGKYYFESRSAVSGYMTWFSYNIDPTLDNYIEMEFAQLKGPVDFGNGILYNHTSTKKDCKYEFLIAANGYFKIFKTINDVNTDVAKWTTTPYVHPQGNNRLGILNKGKYTYYYVNDHLVYTTARTPYIGADIGFSACHSSAIAIDHFSIRYNPPSINLIENAEQGTKKIVLGTNINTTKNDLDMSFPVLSADGKMMVFSQSENMGSIGLDKRSIMYTEYNTASGDWSAAKALPITMNNKGTIQAVYISPDKRTIMIDAKIDANGNFVENEEGLCMIHKNGSGWSAPENVPIDGLTNRDFFSSYALAPSNKVLILSVAADGSYGEQDLYVSFKQNDRWTKPVNMGPVINSFADDKSPCLAPDNVTLYYSSVGKPGYGLSDVFVTRRLDNTWLNWSEPQNLGPDINDFQGNSGLQVDADGQYAYMNVSSPEHVQGQICKIELPESARPKPVMIVSGKVYNKLTNLPMSSPLIYENIETGYEEGVAVSNKDDGSFVIVLPYGKNYGLTAKMPGYIAESKNVNIKTDSVKKGFAEMTVDLYLTPISVGETIKLNNIFFAPDKFELVETSFPELDRLVSIMNENPNLQVQIQGHTDIGGANATPENLHILSDNRANSVRDYLVHKGIMASRISALGFGNTHPVSTIQSQNRRVEVKVTAY